MGTWFCWKFFLDIINELCKIAHHLDQISWKKFKTSKIVIFVWKLFSNVISSKSMRSHRPKNILGIKWVVWYFQIISISQCSTFSLENQWNSAKNIQRILDYLYEISNSRIGYRKHARLIGFSRWNLAKKKWLGSDARMIWKNHGFWYQFKKKIIIFSLLSNIFSSQT